MSLAENKKPILQIENLKFLSPGSGFPILRGVNLNIYSKDFIVLVGRNGSGKSSFLKAIKQKLHPEEGTFYYHGKLVKDWPDPQMQERIMVLEQEVEKTMFLDMTVFENLRLWDLRKKFVVSYEPGVHSKLKEKYSGYLAKFDSKLAKKMETPAGLLSGGEKQAFALALVFLRPPEILLLDEHTSALDQVNSEAIFRLTADLVSSQNVTCIMITHDLQVASQYGNRLVVFRSGLVIEDVFFQEGSQRLSDKDIFNLSF